jgi:hypothetical protein
LELSFELFHAKRANHSYHLENISNAIGNVSKLLNSQHHYDGDGVVLHFVYCLFLAWHLSAIRRLRTNYFYVFQGIILLIAKTSQTNFTMSSNQNTGVVTVRGERIAPTVYNYFPLASSAVLGTVQLFCGAALLILGIIAIVANLIETGSRASGLAVWVNCSI